MKLAAELKSKLQSSVKETIEQTEAVWPPALMAFLVASMPNQVYERINRNNCSVVLDLCVHLVFIIYCYDRKPSGST